MKRISILVAAILLFSVSAAMAADTSVVKKLGIGFQGLTVTRNAITMPTIQYYLDNDTAIEGGICIGSNSTTTNMTLAFAWKKSILKPMGNIHTHWGIGGAYTSNPAMTPNTSAILVSLNVGAEYFVTPEFSVEANISPLMITSATPGGTSWTILSNAVGMPVVVIGAHLYI